MRKRRLVTLAAAVLMVAGSAQASKASATSSTTVTDLATAASASCTVTVTSCETAAVRADGEVLINITTGNFGCSFRIRDVVNGDVVTQGRVFHPSWSVIAGFHGSYRLELYNCRPGSRGYIEG